MTRPFLVSPARKPNYRFGLAEACWILAGSDDARLIGSFNKQMLRFSDDGKHMWGAYGPRLMGQLAHTVETLKRDPDSRQAVVTTWRPQVGPVDLTERDDNLESSYNAMVGAGICDGWDTKPPEWDGSSWRSKDIPCTVAWHFQVRYDQLHLTVFMRSNDVWLGLPYDLLSFTTVQRVVASMLGIEPGSYNHVASNLHLYDSNEEQAWGVVSEKLIVFPWCLPSLRDHFYGCTSDKVQKVFQTVFDDGNDFAEYFSGLQPFVAAVKKEPYRSDVYLKLQKAIHRTDSRD